jgi:hypothetical protein
MHVNKDPLSVLGRNEYRYKMCEWVKQVQGSPVRELGSAFVSVPFA